MGEMMEFEQMLQRERCMQELEAIFDSLDKDQNGTIDMEEFMTWTENLRVRAFFETVLGIDIYRAWHTFKLLDVDNTGDIDKEEFIVGCLRLKGGTKAIDHEMQMRSIRKIQQQLSKMQTVIDLLGKFICKALPEQSVASPMYAL